MLKSEAYATRAALQCKGKSPNLEVHVTEHNDTFSIKIFIYLFLWFLAILAYIQQFNHTTKEKNLNTTGICLCHRVI